MSWSGMVGLLNVGRGVVVRVPGDARPDGRAALLVRPSCALGRVAVHGRRGPERRWVWHTHRHGRPALNYETFLQDLHAARDRAQRFQRHAHDQKPVSAALALALALEELDSTLEELRVAEEEIRVQQEALDDGRARTELDRQHLQALFLLAPASYLVTDPAGVIRQANLRAVDLLGIDGRFVAGKPLASFVDPVDRRRFRDRLSRLPGTEGGEWRVRLRPRDRDPVQVVASVAVGRDHAGLTSELRWLL
jgi:PAS domain-containing protein